MLLLGTLPFAPDDDHWQLYTNVPDPLTHVPTLAAGWNGSLTLFSVVHKVVARTKRIGGGFGGKETRAINLSCAAAVPAWHLRRGVRLIQDRDEDMHSSGHRHPFLGKYKVREGCLKGAGDIFLVDTRVIDQRVLGLLGAELLVWRHGMCVALWGLRGGTPNEVSGCVEHLLYRGGGFVMAPTSRWCCWAFLLRKLGKVLRTACRMVLPPQQGRAESLLRAACG